MWAAAVSLGLLLGQSAEGTAQLDSRSAGDPIRELAFLVGWWDGEIDGTLGPATARRHYQFIIQDRFLLMRHDRDPEERPPGEDAAEEWSIFSFDPERQMIVLREFLVEGLVNRYSCETDRGWRQLVCESEATEGDSELTLRVRYEFTDLDHFTELFEIFGSDGAMRVRVEGQWLRTSEGR